MVPPLKLTPDPVQLANRQPALANAIIKQRPDAKEGDFFSPQYQPYLRPIVKDDFANRPLADRKTLIVEPPKRLKLDINTSTRPTLPLATFPGKLLRALPELPSEFNIASSVGRWCDVEPNVIVDA